MDTSKKRWLGLPFIAMGVALTVIDATIVNVALPSIIDDLGIDSTQAQWTQEIYTLVFASTLLLFGRIADRIGRRRMFDLVSWSSLLPASSQPLRTVDRRSSSPGSPRASVAR